MARAIDANELMVEIQVCSWDSEQDKERAEDLVLGMPTLTPPNEPLTLEELREMKGQPVWTVTTGLDGSGRWELVCDVDYEDVLEMVSCVDGFYAIEMDTYGSTWTAYRRPLERMKKIMRENGIMVIPSEYPGSTENGIFRSHAIRRRNCKMNKCSLFDMTFSEIIEDIFGVSFDRLWDLALADREKRCVVMPGKPGDKFLYKSAAGFWCNAVIKDYMPKNIFITAETEIPNAEPLSHTFSISEVEAALQRDKNEQIKP